MSYYDRLQGAMSGMESSGTSHLNQLNEVKEKAQDQFSGASGQMSAIASNALKGDLKIAGRHIGMKEGLELGNKYIMKPRMAKLQARQKSMDADVQNKQSQLSSETDEITSRAEGRLGADSVNVEPAYKMGDGSIVGESARPTATSAQGTIVSHEGEAMEGKVVPKGAEGVNEADVMAKDTGLKSMEEDRLGEIANSAKTLGSEEVGGVMSKVSSAMDFLGPIGELASLGVMLGEGIKTAVEAHKNAKDDAGSETSAIQTGAQAGMYAGMNRPSFGSMALPSFDTSKSSAMLQQ